MRNWKRGVAVGATANVISSVAEPVERAILGRTPPYHPSAIADAIIQRSGSEAADLTRGTLTLALRWGTGAALGIAYAAVRPVLPRSRVAAGLLFGAALFGVRRTALPWTRVAPPIAEWPRQERIALAVHSFVWALAAATVDGRGRHARQP
jgi:hypothetical protein